jgi:hypothetical protein
LPTPCESENQCLGFVDFSAKLVNLQSRFNPSESSAQGQEMTIARPTPGQRDILQRLRLDSWRSFVQLNLFVSDYLLKRLEANGWVESRRLAGTIELKLTAEGLDALRAKIP